MKSPPWTRDELILALDLYMTTPSARGIKTHPKVIELSELLNRMEIHEDKSSEKTFRNPNGVGMKLSNFLPFDPDYQGKGLERGAKLDKVIWDEFAQDQQRLHAIATAIRSGIDELDKATTTPDDDYPDETEAEEGRVLSRIHKRRERNRKIVERKKKKVLKETGALACEACGFDFAKTYGELGEEFAECHHDKPVSELKPGENTKQSDLRIVCANCHRMIHRKRPWKTVEEIGSIAQHILSLETQSHRVN